MNRDEAQDIMEEAYAELKSELTLSIPVENVSPSVWDTTWYAYCKGIKPDLSTPLRRALTRALIEAE